VKVLLSLHQYQSFWLGWNLIGRAVWPYEVLIIASAHVAAGHVPGSPERSPWTLPHCLLPMERVLLAPAAPLKGAAGRPSLATSRRDAASARCCRWRPEQVPQAGEAMASRCLAAAPVPRAAVWAPAAGPAAMASASHSWPAHERLAAAAATALMLLAAAQHHPAIRMHPAMTHKTSVLSEQLTSCNRNCRIRASHCGVAI